MHNGFDKGAMRGFTLIEALVALVVLSIGMLGIAALYVESLKAGRTAIYRTQAVTLAADMADRIRANPVVDPVDPVEAAKHAAMAVAYEGAGADGGCVAVAANCGQAVMAAHDVFFWQQRVVDLLPGGDAVIQHDPDPGLQPDRYTITISWSEVGEPQDVIYQLVVRI